MTRLIYAAMALAFLSACDAVAVVDDTAPAPAPTTPGTPTGGAGNPSLGALPPPPPITVPEAIAGDLRNASFNAEDSTMRVRITLDASELDAIYTRNTDYDRPGYLAFTKQDDPLDRFFTGYTRTSTDGSVQGSLVVDGGQFTKYFGGTFYSQNGTYTPPAQGLVSYAGTYVGLLNIGTRDGTMVSGEDAELLPFRALSTAGTVFLNADFTNTTVNGTINNRISVEQIDPITQKPIPLPSLFLIPAPIAADGSFAGTVENAAQEGLGDYAGVFGGPNAGGVAGGVRLTGDFFPEIDEEEEYGLFVLDQCGTTPTVCQRVNTLNAPTP